MESASTLSGMPFKQALRLGQKKVVEGFDKVNEINIQLPTGYGKTYTACCCYSVKKKRNKATRLLYVFPTDAQISQFKKDGHVDMENAGVDGPLNIVDCRFYGTEAIKKSIKNTSQIFVTTIQALTARKGMDVANQLLQKGKWMVVIDEYHHYGIEKTWGESVLALNYDCFLAMSATPDRPMQDSAFGKPDVVIKYGKACEEKTVKPLVGHSYIYRLDVIMVDGAIHSYTTDELVDEAGSCSPDSIEKLIINRKMRWSPKYASPLVSIPIERMLKNRLETGFKLQALVGALCVSHAEIVCKQVKLLFPHLDVDWVGTGENGRSQQENRAVLEKFCRPKKEDGKRPTPELDILVHVGMAGEGLDSVFVSEVIHLNKASINNTNDQENGRASRYLPGVTGHINFDSSSGYATAGYVGAAIMDAMDGNDPRELDEQEERGERENNEELPDEPAGIGILNMELEGINSGDARVQRMARVLNEKGIKGDTFDYDEIIKDPDHPQWEIAINMYQAMARKEAEVMNEETTIAQWKEALNNALSAVTGMVVKRITSGQRFDKSLPGDIKRRINTYKKRSVGKVLNDVEVCEKHYKWIVELQREISKDGIPSWLM